MEPNTPLDNLDTDRTLAVLATTSGYVVFPRVETNGVISGFSKLNDADVKRIADQGIPLVDTRHLNKDQSARFSYLNTLTPLSDSRNGPAGEGKSAHLDVWLGICQACGATVHNGEPIKPEPRLFSWEYGTRLVAEGIFERQSRSWQLSADSGYEQTKNLIKALSNLPGLAENEPKARMKDMVTNTILGEALISENRGKGEEEGLKLSRTKLREWMETLADQIKKVPALEEAYPIDLLKQTSKMITRELERGYRSSGPALG